MMIEASIIEADLMSEETSMFVKFASFYFCIHNHIVQDTYKMIGAHIRMFCLVSYWCFAKL